MLHVCGPASTTHSHTVYVILVGGGSRVGSNAVILLSKHHDLCLGQGNNETRITKVPPHLQFFIVIHFFFKCLYVVAGLSFDGLYSGYSYSFAEFKEILLYNVTNRSLHFLSQIENPLFVTLKKVEFKVYLKYV